MDSWTEQARAFGKMQREAVKAYERGEIDFVQMTKLRLQIADRQHAHALSRPKDVPRPAVFEQQVEVTQEQVSPNVAVLDALRKLREEEEEEIERMEQTDGLMD